MLPDGYDQFFVAAASVAGALIGLLFVAISVHPAAAARSAPIATRLRAVAALSAFLDTLFLSLLALRPHPRLGPVSVYLGIVGLVAMVTLLVLLLTDARDARWVRVRGALLVVGQGAVYLLQLIDGIALRSHPEDTERIDNLTVLIVILFAFGIARAWEFVGADNPTLVGAALGGMRGRSSRKQPEPDTADADTVTPG